MGTVGRTVGIRAEPLRAAALAVCSSALLVACSVGAGALVANGAAAWDEVGQGALIGLGALIAILVVRSGAVVCLSAIACLAASGADFYLVSLGELDVVAPDILYAGALCWVAAAAIGRAVDPTVPRSVTPQFGQWAGVTFLTVGGLSLLFVATDAPGALSHSAVSWLRFAQTASLALLAAATIHTKRDLGVVLTGIAAGCVVAVGSGVVEVLEGAPLGERISGMHGPNELALASGVLVMIGAFATGGDRPRTRAFLIVAGVVGLLLGKSVGVFIATGVALAVGASFARRGVGVQRATTAIAALVIAGVVVAGAIQWLRPESNPASNDFTYNSTSQRVIVGAAGLEIFERHPVIGVGWRRSDAPDVIGARDLNFELRQRFQGARPDFFPDVLPASVHNAYIQVLAELGIVGFAAFVTLLAVMFVNVRRLLRRIPRGDPLWGYAWGMSLSLLLLLLWFNENPLYGGQVDTMLAAVMIGCLARMTTMLREPRDAPPQA